MIKLAIRILASIGASQLQSSMLNSVQRFLLVLEVCWSSKLCGGRERLVLPSFPNTYLAYIILPYVPRVLSTLCSTIFIFLAKISKSFTRISTAVSVHENGVHRTHVSLVIFLQFERGHANVSNARDHGGFLEAVI